MLSTKKKKKKKSVERIGKSFVMRFRALCARLYKNIGDCTLSVEIPDLSLINRR